MTNIQKSVCWLRTMTLRSVSESSLNEYHSEKLWCRELNISVIFYLRKQCHSVASVQFYLSLHKVSFGVIKQLKYTILGFTMNQDSGFPRVPWHGKYIWYLNLILANSLNGIQVLNYITDYTIIDWWWGQHMILRIKKIPWNFTVDGVSGTCCHR